MLIYKKINRIGGEEKLADCCHKKENIDETKVQTYWEESYKILAKYFSQVSIKYYTFQVRSQKGMNVLIKGLHTYIDP